MNENCKNLWKHISEKSCSNKYIASMIKWIIVTFELGQHYVGDAFLTFRTGNLDESLQNCLSQNPYVNPFVQGQNINLQLNAWNV